MPLSEPGGGKPRPRGRELGIAFPGVTGVFNAITDVPGVEVGQVTLIEGGHLRTGVTAILPRGRAPAPVPVWAGLHSFNGNGEMTGSHWIRDAGHFLGPVCITNTHGVGIAHHAAVRWMIDTHAAYFAGHAWAMPVVAETYDGVLNDINAMALTEAHVRAALDGARPGSVAEGATGGGTGMIAYEFKAGTGTASRRIRVAGQDHVLGVLVQANHGLRDWLTVLGVPVGAAMPEERMVPARRESGSIIVVIATDAPLRPDQLQRLAKRGALGIGRGGTIGGNNSGDIFLALSTANGRSLAEPAEARFSMEVLGDGCLDEIYRAAVEGIEEAVVNAMVACEGMVTFKPPGLYCPGIDTARLCGLLRAAGRCY